MDKRNPLNKNQIIPSRIKEARLARGYSLSELSHLVGVSSQAISQYELGTVQPSSAVLMKMIEVLDFPLRFFKKSKPASNQEYSPSAVYFRSMKSASKKDKDAYQMRIGWADEVYDFLRNYIDFPAVDLPDFSDLLNEDMDYAEITAIADRLRNHWGMGAGPIPNLVDLLQEKGFVICDIETGNKKIDAFSRWYNNVPYILHGTDKGSAVRARFDLAHELGHLIMHLNIEQSQLSQKDVLDRVEDEANYFAGAFLLPASSFAGEIMSVSIEHFIMLKRRWKVSIAAMIKRCHNLNLINDNQVKNLFIQMNKRGIRIKEPLDDVLELERPYLFKQAIELLISNKLFSPDGLLDELILYKDELDSLLFLPKDLLTRKENVLNLRLIENEQSS